MCPGNTLAFMRGGYSAPRSSAFYTAGRDVGGSRHYDHVYGSRQFANQRERFVIVEDGESGTSVIETTPNEIVTIQPGENGGLIVAIEAVDATQPAEPVIVSPPM
jgi:hypothetical protein